MVSRALRAVAIAAAIVVAAMLLAPDGWLTSVSVGLLVAGTGVAAGLWAGRGRVRWRSAP